jgi:hypothetical protein
MMRNGWETGKFWFYHALDSPLGLRGLFWQHIQPIFARSHINDPEFDRIMSAYWIVDSDKFISTKIAQKVDYDRELRKAFNLKLDDSSRNDSSVSD